MTAREQCPACAGDGWQIVPFEAVKHRPGGRYGEVCPRCQGQGTVPVTDDAPVTDRSRTWRQQIGADIEQERAKP